MNEDKLHKNSLISLLLPSFLGILLCAVCICGMTWAWFSESVESSAQKLTAANYFVSVESIRSEAGSVDFADGGYRLEANKTYTVALTASGTVKACGGYCLIQNESGEKTYTQTFKPEESITVRFTPNADGIYTFTGVWGSLPVGTTDYLTHTEQSVEPSTEPSTEPRADLSTKSSTELSTESSTEVSVPDKTSEPITTEPTAIPQESEIHSEDDSEPSDTVSADSVSTGEK